MIKHARKVGVSVIAAGALLFSSVAATGAAFAVNPGITTQSSGGGCHCPGFGN
ncbi:hypothetical protein J2S36_000590 [Arcanobacterium hippocoleae]|uniref:Uncharacterized protein n=1 Tax=Arcanobacterium hippocoleae TaxID=149017 RepID=A0ABU1T109_9ACTO|nr:hypothetical protein [Arcanobacterium hippocoleae]